MLHASERETLRAQLFPDLRVALAGCRALPATACCYPEEHAHVARAIAKRQHEFLAGRHCAREALAALGVAAQAIQVGPRRAPVWPAGQVGSISHARGLVLAVAAQQEHCAGLGIDAEHLERPMRPQLERMICRPGELDALVGGPEEAGLRRMLVFSAKEALYKCLAPRTKSFFGFQAACLLDARGGRLELELQQAQPGFAAGTRVFGRWLHWGEHLICSCSDVPQASALG